MNIKILAPDCEGIIPQDAEWGNCLVIEGTLQRVHYLKRELTVIAQGKIWNFTLAPDCQLWFDDQPALLRCFHPLDRVKVHFAGALPRHVLKAIFAWEKQSA